MLESVRTRTSHVALFVIEYTPDFGEHSAGIEFLSKCLNFQEFEKYFTIQKLF